MQNVDVMTLVLKWLHILAAMAIVGGAIFMRFGLLPAASESLEPGPQDKLGEAVRARWARFVHTCIAVLLVTGLANFSRFAMSSSVPAMPYHAVFGIKFVLALLVFFVATAVVGKSTAFARARQNMGAWLTGLIVLAVVIVLLSGLLNQVRLVPRSAASPTAAAPAVEN